jgi:RHS repeat-associated protein
LTDPAIGFLDLRARDLDPALGRFLSADTVSPNAPGSQGYNLYAYVANNPTTWVDPSGHDPEEALAAIAVGVELLGGLALVPELVGLAGLVVTGIVVAIIFAGVAAILSCALNVVCRANFEQDMTSIGEYGSGAAAGAWTLSGQATRFGWQHSPDLPNGPVCALGAAEGIATNTIFNAVGGNHSSASDTTFAAAMGCASGGSSGGGGGGVNNGKINPFKIRFSQDTISPNFQNGAGSIDDLVVGLKSGRVSPDSIPPIRIFEQDGELYTLDNRRLWVFRQANVDIPYRWAKQQEVAKDLSRGKFSTQNGGNSIRVRGRR